MILLPRGSKIQNPSVQLLSEATQGANWRRTTIRNIGPLYCSSASITQGNIVLTFVDAALWYG
jgi:hypothetical protein